MARDTLSTRTLVVYVMERDGSEPLGTFTATLSAPAVEAIWSSYQREPTPQAIPVLIWVDKTEMTTLRDLIREDPSDGGGTPPQTVDEP